MNIHIVIIDGEEYKLFKDVTLFPNSSSRKVVLDYVAEERLDEKIRLKIDEGKYNEVHRIDCMYGYVVPQCIADTNNEEDIRESIENIYEE